MWSLGCIVVELFLGLPLFPGSSEYNQVARITEMLGMPPTWMLEMGKQSNEFFEKASDEFGRKQYRLKSMEQYAREHGTKEQPSKRYFSATNLPDIINNYPMPRKNMKQAEVERGKIFHRMKSSFDWEYSNCWAEMNNRKAFIDFAQGLLNLNPLERWTPNQAKLHPFITQQKFNGPFVPPMTLRASSSKSPAPGVQEQQRAEAMSKQRQQAQQQAAAQAQAQAYASMQLSPYPSSPLATQAPAGMYNVYGSPTHAAPPPAYGHQQPPPSYSNPPIANVLMAPPAQPGGRYQPAQGALAPQQQSSLYAQATTRAGRQRASTLEQHQSGVPLALQRVMGHLDPNAPIRLQPSPAYYPPPADGGESAGVGGSRGAGRRGSRVGRSNRDFIRTLEERTLEEGYMGGNSWQ